MPHIVLLGTCDTKLEELLYLRSQILEQSQSTRITFVDVGRSPTKHEAITITQDTLTTKYQPAEAQDVASLSRGDVIKYMITCASHWLREAYARGLDDRKHAIHGIVSAGGTGGTSLAAGVMRENLPIGFPKLIVSTAASGDTGPVVGESDITLTYSVVDIAGTNSLLKRILSNAAGSIHGMATAYEKSSLLPPPYSTTTTTTLAATTTTADSSKNRRNLRVGLTMFGVTTPCVDKIRSYLECPSSSSPLTIECLVFHCTGHGGKAMERLIEQGDLDAVLDLTTTEICDHVAGGVMSAGPHRLEAALRAGIPYVISLGATDMVNFGPRGTVPERYISAGRVWYEHNPTVTLMRTSVAECRAIGEFIVEKVVMKKKGFAAEKRKENVKVVLPLGGVSMISTPGGPFYDKDADEALFGAVREGLRDSGVEVVEDERAINDEGFAVDIAKRLLGLMMQS